uniref:Cytokin_check_N domain-containing protein n=1 Tax=Parastrongyloides trichosuri TaxID=131310 RepID=A0A0N4Z656_PARTI
MLQFLYAYSKILMAFIMFLVHVNIINTCFKSKTKLKANRKSVIGNMQKKGNEKEIGSCCEFTKRLPANQPITFMSQGDKVKEHIEKMYGEKQAFYQKYSLDINENYDGPNVFQAYLLDKKEDLIPLPKSISREVTAIQDVKTALIQVPKSMVLVSAKEAEPNENYEFLENKPMFEEKSAKDIESALLKSSKKKSTTREANMKSKKQTEQMKGSPQGPEEAYEALGNSKVGPVEQKHVEHETKSKGPTEQVKAAPQVPEEAYEALGNSKVVPVEQPKNNEPIGNEQPSIGNQNKSDPKPNKVEEVNNPAKDPPKAPEPEAYEALNNINVEPPPPAANAQAGECYESLDVLNKFIPPPPPPKLKGSATQEKKTEYKKSTHSKDKSDKKLSYDKNLAQFTDDPARQKRRSLSKSKDRKKSSHNNEKKSKDKKSSNNKHKKKQKN